MHLVLNVIVLKDTEENNDDLSPSFLGDGACSLKLQPECNIRCKKITEGTRWM